MDDGAQTPDVARWTVKGYLGTLPAHCVVTLGPLFHHRQAEVANFQIRPGSVVTISCLEEDIVGLNIPVAD